MATLVTSVHGIKDVEFTSGEKDDIETFLGVDTATVTELCNPDYFDWIFHRILLAKMMDLIP